MQGEVRISFGIKDYPGRFRFSGRPSESEGFHPFLFRLSSLTLLFLRRFFKKTPFLDLLEKSVFLELAFERLERFLYIISVNFYIQNRLSPSPSGTSFFTETSLFCSESSPSLAESAPFSRLLRPRFTDRKSPFHK